MRAGNQLPGFAGRGQRVLGKGRQMDHRLRARHSPPAPWPRCSRGPDLTLPSRAQGDRRSARGAVGVMDRRTSVVRGLGTPGGQWRVASKIYSAETYGRPDYPSETTSSPSTTRSRPGQDAGGRAQAAQPCRRVWRVGAPLGADNELVYKEFLGMSDAAYADLEASGVI